MSVNTKIEWCDHSWSPWTGCTKVSAGCAHCYAEARDKRHLQEKVDHWGKGAPRLLRADSSWKEPMKWDRAAARREAFLEGQGGNKVFPSLCDWLDDEVPIEWLARFLKLIHDTPRLTWLLLTKRPENWQSRLRMVCGHLQGKYGMEEGQYQEDPVWDFCNRWIPWNGINRFNPPTNVWIGTSVEDQANADRRIPELLKIPASGRFLSLEPLLGPVELSHMDVEAAGDNMWCQINALTGRHTDMGRPCPEVPKLDWLIIGGESGHGARPCNVEWIRGLVKQGKVSGVPTFVKQLGANPVQDRLRPGGPPIETCPLGIARLLTHPKCGDPSEWPEDLRVREFPEGLR